MTNKDALALIEKLQAENEARKKQGVKRLSYKVSEKGGVSVYGLGRFPVTLYQTQWIRLLDISDQLREFMVANADKLTQKGDNIIAQSNKTAKAKAKALREMADEDEAAMTKTEMLEVIERMQSAKNYDVDGNPIA